MLLAGLATIACLLGMLSARPAHAERPCLGDPSVTGRICDEATCLTLQAAKNAACSPSPGKCIPGEGCFNLRAKSTFWHGCYVARSRINVVCWAGGDYDHQWQAAEAIRLASECDAIIDQPAPVGCGPCLLP